MSAGPTSKRGSSAEKSAGFGPVAERFRRAGDLERAVALCKEGLAKFPDHLSGRVTLGWALLDLGRYDEARFELEQVLKRAPDNLAAIRGLAELHDRAESTMYLDMAGQSAWPPEQPHAAEEPAPAAEEPARHVEPASVAATDAALPHPQAAPPDAAAASADETPEIITTAQAAMAEVAPAASDAPIVVDEIAPAELLTTAQAAVQQDEAQETGAGAAAQTPLVVEPVDAAEIETAAQAIAPSAPVPEPDVSAIAAPAPEAAGETVADAGDVDIEIAAREADELEALAAALGEAGETAATLEVAAALDADATPAGTADAETPTVLDQVPAADIDDLSRVVAALEEASVPEQIFEPAPVDLAFVEPPAEPVESGLADALADAVLDRAAEWIAPAVADAEVAASGFGAMQAAEVAETAEAVDAGVRVELDLVPDDAVTAMADAADVAGHLAQAAQPEALDEAAAAEGPDDAVSASAPFAAHPDASHEVLAFTQETHVAEEAEHTDEAVEAIAPVTAAEEFPEPHVEAVEVVRADDPEPVVELPVVAAASVAELERVAEGAVEAAGTEPLVADSVEPMEAIQALAPSEAWAPPVAAEAAPAAVEDPSEEPAEAVPAVEIEPVAALAEVALDLSPAVTEAADPIADLELATPLEAAPLPEPIFEPVAPPPATERVLLELPVDLPAEPPAPALAEVQPFVPAGARYDVTGAADARSTREPGTKSRKNRGKARRTRSSPVPQLERLLRGVEARRVEIASESVA